jgi:acetyltransferase-like isoleucine patch superfamily enzyme
VIMSAYFTSDTAIVADSASIGDGTKIWDYARVRENVTLGENVIIGSYVYVGPGITVGRNSKIQNNAQVYEPAVINAGVFIGPGVIFTNDHNPRAINPDGSQKSANDWQQAGVVVNQGASIGAGAVCVGPVQIGEWAMVGAGSVVTDNVLNFALVVGVPAKQIGWVGKSGVKLIEQSPTSFKCPTSGELYELKGLKLIEAGQ